MIMLDSPLASLLAHFVESDHLGERLGCLSCMHSWRWWASIKWSSFLRLGSQGGCSRVCDIAHQVNVYNIPKERNNANHEKVHVIYQ